MRIAFTLPLLALGLAACSSEPEAPKSQEEVLAAMEELATPEPGLYRTTTEIVDFSVPGMPAEQAAKMKDMQGNKSEVSEQCLTQAEADKGFKEMLKQISKPSEGLNCDFTKFDVDGSDLDAKLNCTGPSDAGAEIALAGQIKSDGSDLTMEMKVNAGPLGQMNMKMKTKSERIGPCG